MSNQTDPIDITIKNIPREEFSKYQLLDIREDDERQVEPVISRDCKTFPFSTFGKDSFLFERDRKYLIFCGKGGRSRRMVETLREQGVTNTFSVVNGIASVNSYLKNF